MAGDTDQQIRSFPIDLSQYIFSRHPGTDLLRHMRAMVRRLVPTSSPMTTPIMMANTIQAERHARNQRRLARSQSDVKLGCIYRRSADDVTGTDRHNGDQLTILS